LRFFGTVTCTFICPVHPVSYQMIPVNLVSINLLNFPDLPY